MRFSILIPAFKKAYFRECLESVLTQDFVDYEVVVVNDASPEDLDAVIEEFKDNPKLRYYKNEKNYGIVHLVDNWNKCLGYAQGEYIINMGDDDLLLPCCLSEYDKLIRQFPDLAVYHGWTKIIDSEGHFIDIQMPRPLKESAYTMILQAWNDGKQWIGDFCFRTQTLREQGGFHPFPMAWGSDRITAIKCAAVAGIANTQVPVFQYRVHRSRLTESNNTVLKIDTRQEITKWYEEFLSKKADNDVDELMRVQAKMTLHSFQKGNTLRDIVNDMQSNGFFKRFLFWWKRRGQYGLSNRDMIKAGLFYLKNKFI